MPRGDSLRLFGTDGIRAVAGEFPLDEATVEAIGESLARNLARELGHMPEIVVGRDTRESGPFIEQALTSGASRAGARVTSAGVITTPGVAYLTRITPFDAGVVISASHNPYQDNGIKVFSPSGKKLPDEIERRMEEDLAHKDNGRASERGRTESAASDKPTDLLQSNARYLDRYIDYLVSEVGAGLGLGGLHIALDCANGAASAIAPRVFEGLGARVEIIGASPDGRNINERCGSLHLEGLQRFVVERRLDLGIAFDGDADRTLFVDSGGSLVGGDHMLLILAEHMKERGKLRGDLVVATVMSNIGLEIALRDRGVELVRAQVGDKYVLEELINRDAKIGGEQSGHIILPDISLAGDGLITAIEVLRAVREAGKGLGDLASRLKLFPQVLVNVRVRSKPPIETLPEVMAEIIRVENEMRGRGRLLVRYSGTENLARVMIEGEDQTTINRQADRLAEVIKEAIG